MTDLMILLQLLRLEQYFVVHRQRTVKLLPEKPARSFQRHTGRDPLALARQLDHPAPW